MVKFNIEITYSKFLAFLILVFSFIVAIIQKDYSILNISIPIISTLIISKQTNDQIKSKKP